MFELVIFIIIISCVLKSKKKKNNSVPASTPRRSPQVAERAPVRPVQNKPQTAPVRPVQNKPQTAKSPAKPVHNKPEEMSTMEMLEAKAKEDDREERLEKQRQKIENKKHYGHLNYAERYIIGDAVPKGKKMVFCPYCYAENLIPTYSAARDYNCYFCRENM